MGRLWVSREYNSGMGLKGKGNCIMWSLSGGIHEIPTISRQTQQVHVRHGGAGCVQALIPNSKKHIAPA